jgi:hypothetical protein
MSDEAPETPKSKIIAYQSFDTEGHICWKARGKSARDPAGLAKALGVPEDQLTHALDLDAYAADQRRNRRVRSRVCPSSSPW